jgi:hypothetical protein
MAFSDAYSVHLKERRTTSRAVFIVDKAGALVNVPKLCFCLVVAGHDLAGPVTLTLCQG